MIFILQTFSKNPYFEDRVLQKVYQFNESPGRRNEPADTEGFKWSMLDFDWDEDVKALVRQPTLFYASYILMKLDRPAVSTGSRGKICANSTPKKLTRMAT